MLCHYCDTPMKNLKGSEKGIRKGKIYETEEVKVCPKCGCMVRETYKAEEIKTNKICPLNK